MSEEEWVTVKRQHRFRGRPLRDWSMGEVLAAVLSEEGHRFVIDGFGYATLLADRNAADAMPWVLIEARPESENRTLVDGMERLPRELAARFTAVGGDVHLKHRLIGFDREADGFRLRFDGPPDATARRIVLAVPHRGLELLSTSTPLLTAPDIRSLLASVAAHPAAKLFLVYERPWWRDCGITGMRSVSDLRLSKTYYFDQGQAAGGSAVLLASYSDGSNRDGWRALIDGDDLPADPDALETSTRWERYAAGPELIAEAQRQLCALHGVEDIPDPVASAFIDWGVDPFGGAWHVWNVSVRSWEVMPRIVRPIEGLEIYVCGEAYSRSQGWVEGALESAERVVGLVAGSRLSPAPLGRKSTMERERKGLE